MTKSSSVSKPMRGHRAGTAISGAHAKPIASHIGGHLALDFCNTAGEHLSARPEEKLHDWEAFIRWAVEIGLIEAAGYPKLRRHASPIAKVLQLREAIYRVGLAIVGRERIPQRDILVIREQANAPKPAIVSARDGLRWRLDPSRVSAQMRAILASEALSLFCSPRASRMGLCEGGQCGWLFLDESRGKRRRWCDMKDCGNKAKARRYYQQRKAK